MWEGEAADAPDWGVGLNSHMASDFKSEEDVKFKYLMPFLAGKGYKDACISFNVAIEVQEGRKKKTIFADAIVYSSSVKKAPLIVCETKAPTEILDKVAREQAISYARLLPEIAPLALITNGSQIQVFHTLNKGRLPELPKRGDLDSGIVKFVLDRQVRDALREEAKHNLFIIDDVATFKNILRACHNEIRNNQGLDPTAAFDEMSKVMFCKLYEEKENPQNNRFRLSAYDEGMRRFHTDSVKKIFEEAKIEPAYAGLFSKDAEINLNPRTIRKIIELFESYDLGLTAFDVKGEAFEYFLGDTFTGGLGEFFTPRNIVEFMVDAVDPKIGETIIDPFCGTGGFMIYAFELVGEKIRLNEFSEEEKKRWRLELSNRCLYGTDWKERTSQACKMNMMVHGDGSSGVFMHDGFVDIPGKIEEGKFDLCLTNPPFGATESDPKVLGRYELGSGRNSQDRVILAVERCLRLIKPGGWVGMVVIDGVLNNKSTKYVREYIKRHAWVRGVVSLNKETFEGYGAKAKTSILFLEKKQAPDEGDQQPVFMAIADNTGLAPNGDSVPGNVLPDILLDYKACLKGEEPGQHSRSWRAALGDRLDAEFYVRGSRRDEADVEALRREAEDVQARALDSVAALAGLREAFAEAELEEVRLGDLLEEKVVKERIDPNATYRMLGVKWWGNGTFVRETLLGRKMKGTTRNRVSAGWIIYNRLFAFRGSFAIVRPEHDGCYVSGEFPTFAAKAEVKNPDLVCRYIVHCLNSPQYLQVIDKQSTGSTKQSRNRFNQALFVELTVRLPKAEAELRRIVDLLDRADTLREEQERLFQISKDLRDGVLRLLPEPST